MKVESNSSLSLVISRVGRGVSVGVGGSFSMQSKCIWLDVEEKTTTSNN